MKSQNHFNDNATKSFPRRASLSQRRRRRRRHFSILSTPRYAKQFKSILLPSAPNVFQFSLSVPPLYMHEQMLGMGADPSPPPKSLDPFSTFEVSESSLRGGGYGTIEETKFSFFFGDLI